MKKRKKRRRLRPQVKAVLISLLFIAGFWLSGAGIVYAQLNADNVYRHVRYTDTKEDTADIKYDVNKKVFIDTKTSEVICKQTLLTSEDGKKYSEILLDKNGQIVRGWFKENGESCYYEPDHGYKVTGAYNINGLDFLFDAKGHPVDRAWSKKGTDSFWYEDGRNVAETEDKLLFVEGETGFFWLDSGNNGAAARNCEKVLPDGRTVKFDSQGRIETQPDFDELYYPVVETSETATETKAVPVSEYEHAVKAEDVRYVSHRGYHVSAQENTLEAFRDSLKAGYHFVECDIQITSDNVPVLIHDPFINSVACNKDGSAISDKVYVKNLTYDELCEYDFGLMCGEAYAGTKPTTLNEFLAFCKASDIHPYIELKSETVDTDEDVRLVTDAIKVFGMEDKVSVISFSPYLLDKVLNELPNTRVGYLIASEDAVNSYMPMAIAQAESGHNVFIDAAHTVSVPVLNQCRPRNIPVELWMVNWQNYLVSMDPYVSGITTDNLLH